MRRHAQRTGAIAALMLTTIPAVAMADDLSALVFLVFIWPAGILLSLFLLVMTGITVVKLIRRRTGRKAARFGMITALCGVGSALFFAVFTLGLEWYYADFRHLDVALWHIAAFSVLASIPVILGLILRSRAK